jgi:hypothetical protein
MQCGVSSAVGAQAHCDVHYRWQQKIDLSSLSAMPFGTTTVAQMLTWSAPTIGSTDASWCTARNARERRVYQVTAWARRYKVQNGNGDHDWHIELTGSKAGDVLKCIVVEIPPADLDSAYWYARQDLLRIIGTAGSVVTSSGDFVPAVRVTVTGLAFFDGEHRGAEGTSNPPSRHGRCNSKVSALWEIHPVYSVRAP